MCDPLTMAMSGLNAVSTFSQINNQNELAAQNRVNATRSMNDSVAQEQLSFTEQNRALIQGGFDAVLEGRASEATAYTSAIENGVQGNSVKALMRSARQQTQRSTTRTTQEIESLEAQTGENLRHIQTNTVGRINSVSPTSFGVGDLAGVLAPIVKSEME